MKEKTAEEMFKELGYEVFKNDKYNLVYFLRYYNEEYNCTEETSILFQKQPERPKGYSVMFWDGYRFVDGAKYTITPDLHQAITKQMQELGWI